MSTTTESVSTTYTHIHSIAPAIQFTLLRMLNTYVFTTEYIPNYTTFSNSTISSFELVTSAHDHDINKYLVWCSSSKKDT